MRIALTALTPQGPRDIIVSGDDGATVGDVAAALGGIFRDGTGRAARSHRPSADSQGLARVVELPRAGRGGTGARTGGAGPRTGTLWMDGRSLNPDAPAPAALRPGALIAPDPRTSAAADTAEPAGVVELRTVGGPAAGTVYRLGYGTITIGSSPNCHVRVGGTGVPPLAAEVVVAPGAGGATLQPVSQPGGTAGEGRRDAAPAKRESHGAPATPPATAERSGAVPWGALPGPPRRAPREDPATQERGGGRWGTPPKRPPKRASQGAPATEERSGEGRWGTLLLDGEPVTSPRPWPFGSLLTVGAGVFTLTNPEAPDAHLSPVGDGGLAYNRPPRLLPSDRPRRIEVPAEPKRPDKPRLQLLAALLPLALGLLMVKFFHSWLFGLFMLMSPVMVLGQWISDRRHGRVSHKKAMKEYRAKMAALGPRIAADAGADAAQRRDAAPDPAQVLLTATGPRRRLWERRADDPDTLELRIGMTDLPANVEFVPERNAPHDMTLPPPPTARNVPVTLPFPRLGVVGLAGPVNASRGLARWLVAQAATLHSPRDLKIVVLTEDPDAGAHWNWVRWLPHCAPDRGQECLALVGTDHDSAAKRVNELAAEVEDRLKRASEQQFAVLGALGGGDGIPGPELGPKILLVMDGARPLRRIPGMPQVLAASRRAGVYAVCIDEAERVLPEECATVISWDTDQPGWVTMRGSGFDVLGRVLAEQVGVKWAERVARAMAPVRDVSRDDAEAMIPSSARLLEILQMPDPDADQVTAAWQRLGRTTAAPVGVCADGPFSIDLRVDGPHGLVGGTTGSGKSELLQTLIASLAVANRPDSMTFLLIDYKGGSAFSDCARLPHTVGMVSDLDGHRTGRALASLAAELKRREEILLRAGAKDIEDYWDTRRLRPELEPVPRLVLIIDEFAALVGELPDFVDGLIDIGRRGRSLGVHLILATQRPAGVVSADMRANTNLRIALRVTDAAESEDILDSRDAAFISESTPGRCYVRSGSAAPVAVQSARIGGRRPGSGPPGEAAEVIAVPWRGLGRPLPKPGAAADETMITDLSVLVDAIREAGTKLGIAEQRSPWLPPLPEVVTLDELAAGDGRAGQATDVPPLPFGLTDVPARQSREPLTFDLAHGSHLVVAGAARTGRSTVLRTLAGSAAALASPSDVHIYAIDCGSGSMLPLTALPHCGAVVTRDQTERMERLLSKLRGEITRRQQILASEGFAGLAEQRAATTGDRLPWMLLLLDWWEGFVAAFEHYDYGRLIDSLLQILREGAAVGLHAVVTTDRSALIGQVGTVFGRRMVLRMTDRGDGAWAGVNERSMPARQPPGRVMFEGTPNPFEAQIAMLDRDPSGPAQVAALRRLGEQAAHRYARPPQPLRPMRVDPLPPRITAEETWKLDPEFAAPSPMWALAGAGGDELAPQGIDVRDEGPGVVVAGPPRSGRSTTLMTMARSLLGQRTPIMVVTPRRSPLRSLDGEPGVLGVFGADADPAALASAVEGQERYVVLVDDAELLLNAPLSDELEKVVVSGRDADHGLIMAGSTGDFTRAFSGFIPAALKSRCGIFVAVESPSDGDLFGVRLPRNAGAGRVGRGLLVKAGTVTPIQLAVSH